MAFSVKHTNPEWEFSHAKGRCGGPCSITADGSPVLSMLDCSFNGVSDSNLRASSSRLYHKAGQSVFESDGVFPSGPSINQICRYAGNAVRITWDVAWPKETRPTKPFQIGNARLEGRWTKLTTISRDGSPESFDLSKGVFEVPGTPISLILHREDGVKFEYSLGYDLWRWDHALGQPVAAPFSLEINDGQTTIFHCVCDPTPEEVFPEARKYRFMALVAFSTPSMPKAPSVEAPETVSFTAGKPDIDARSLSSNLLRINYLDMPNIENGKRLTETGRHDICLEDNHSLMAVKRTIRQLASFSDNGTLLLEGLVPGLCTDGSHCEKKQPRQHCDLYSLVTFLAWAKNCLGSGWTIMTPQPSPWNELPSLAYSHLPLDFDY